MSNRKFVVGAEHKSLLSQAADKHLPVTITTRQDRNWQVYKSNFFCLQANRLVFSHPVPDANDCHMELAPGQEVAVTFKKGYYKFLFTTRAISQEQYELDPGVFVPAIVVLLPERVEKIQRRAYNRVAVPKDLSPVKVTFARYAEDDGQPAESWEGALSDLSAGGVSVVIDASIVSHLQVDEQFELCFTPLAAQDELSLSVRFRHTTNIPGSDQQVLGFQIIGLEIDEEGLGTLRQIARVVSVYKRRIHLSRQPQVTGP